MHAQSEVKPRDKNPPHRLTSQWACCVQALKLPSLHLLLSLQDIFEHCTEGGVMSVTEIPYFEEHFWPNVIEENIKELEEVRESYEVN